MERRPKKKTISVGPPNIQRSSLIIRKSDNNKQEKIFLNVLKIDSIKLLIKIMIKN